MTSLKKAIGFGLLTWLIPFIVSFAFYTPEGEIRGDIFLFKSVMLIVSVAASSELIIRYLRGVKDNYMKEGALLGALWLGMNLLLDVIILMPISDLTAGEYINQIGLRYLMIPIIATSFGIVARNASANT